MARGGFFVALLATVFAVGSAYAGFSSARDAGRFLASAIVSDARIVGIAVSGTGARAQRRFHFALRLPDGTEAVVPAWRPVNATAPALRVGDRVQVVHDGGNPMRVQLDHASAAYGAARDWYEMAALCLAAGVAAGLFGLQRWRSVPRLP